MDKVAGFLAILIFIAVGLCLLAALALLIVPFMGIVIGVLMWAVGG